MDGNAKGMITRPDFIFEGKKRTISGKVNKSFSTQCRTLFSPWSHTRARSIRHTELIAHSVYSTKRKYKKDESVGDGLLTRRALKRAQDTLSVKNEVLNIKLLLLWAD